MKRIFVDMDGVLADVYGQFIKYEERDSGITIKIADTIGLDETEIFPNVEKHIYEPGFFRTLNVIEDSIDVMKYMNAKYEVLILSAAMEFPNSLREKYDWLAEHFPFIKWQQIVFCGNKGFVSGDILIDDNMYNLDVFRGEKLLFNQPHNQLVNNPEYTRIYHWSEIGKML